MKLNFEKKGGGVAALKIGQKKIRTAVRSSKIKDPSLWGISWSQLSFFYIFFYLLQGPEAVAAALAGCKILKEMARLESEAESARSMKEAKYEQFALGE